MREAEGRAGVPCGGVSLYSTPQWWGLSGGVLWQLWYNVCHETVTKTNQCCHLISRIANRAFFLNDEEKTRFVERLWRVATFSCVEVLAYCFMSNHFHILVYGERKGQSLLT